MQSKIRDLRDTFTHLLVPGMAYDPDGHDPALIEAGNAAAWVEAFENGSIYTEDDMPLKAWQFVRNFRSKFPGLAAFPLEDYLETVADEIGITEQDIQRMRSAMP